MKTMFEMSYDEWRIANRLLDGSIARAAWSEACAAEWTRIQASLTANGHWHSGVSCASAQCGKAPS